MSIFEKLNAINVNEYAEKKKTGKDRSGKDIELTYLSWTWAVKVMTEVCPDWDYEIVRTKGLPYSFDPQTGYMVTTRVTVDGKTKEMWLPVMDGANRAMKAEPYTIKTRFGEISVQAATMFDINKTIMRCLVKNLAMFGLGLYIYAGEDLPEAVDDEDPKPAPKPAPNRARQDPVEDPETLKQDIIHLVGGDMGFITDTIAKTKPGARSLDDLTDEQLRRFKSFLEKRR